MSRIRSKNTKPEIRVRKFLHQQGFRFRLHVTTLPGKPDIVLSKYRTVLFINGCFWHGHKGCKFFVVPKTRTEWWLRKINGTISNDARATKQLKQQGWHVIYLWECVLKTDNFQKTMNKLTSKLKRA